MKTFREIAEMHYASEPTNEFDKQYRENRINALERLLNEQLSQPPVSGRVCFSSDCFYNDKTLNTCVGDYEKCTVKQTHR